MSEKAKSDNHQSEYGLAMNCGHRVTLTWLHASVDRSYSPRITRAGTAINTRSGTHQWQQWQWQGQQRQGQGQQGQGN